MADDSSHPSRPPVASRLAWGLAAATLLVPPLVVLSANGDPYRLPKLLVSEGLALLSLLALVPAAMRSGIGFLDGARRSPAVRAILPLLAVATVTLGTSADLAFVREGLWSFWVGAGVLVGWSMGLRRFRSLLGLIVAPAAFLALVGILQYYEVLRELAPVKARVQMSSLAGAVGDLTAYLVLPMLIVQLPLVLALRRRFERDEEVRKRIDRSSSAVLVGSGALLVLFLFALAVAQTWTALLALAASSVVLWSALLPRRATVAATVAAVLVGIVLLLGPLAPRLQDARESIAQGSVNRLLSGRLDGWMAAWWMFREHPLTGVGHGAYGAEFGETKLAMVEAGWEPFQRHIYPYFGNAHNDYLEILAELGLPGALALGWGLWLLGRRIVARRRLRVEPDPDVALVLAGTTAFAVLALAYFPFHIALTAYPAIALLAWIFSTEFVPPAQGEEGS